MTFAQSYEISNYWSLRINFDLESDSNGSFSATPFSIISLALSNGDFLVNTAANKNT